MEPDRASARLVRTDGQIQIVLDAALSVRQVRAFYQELAGVLEDGQPVMWEAAKVDRIDAAALQLLATFCTALRARGIPWRWTSVTPALRDGAGLLGLEVLLGLES